MATRVEDLVIVSVLREHTQKSYRIRTLRKVTTNKKYINRELISPY